MFFCFALLSLSNLVCSSFARVIVQIPPWVITMIAINKDDLNNDYEDHKNRYEHTSYALI